jgi:hypothetical protein
MALSLLLSLCRPIANRSSECAESPGATCTRRYTPVWMRVITLLACVSQCGCFGLGTTRFYQDQLGYSRAVGDAEKSNTLLNAVRLRYGDTPVVLQPTQVISGYQLQRNVSGGFEVFPAANPSTFLNGSASAQLQQSPTFTFQPLSGAQFAQSFVQPLSPADLLPLVMGDLPIDVLFRLSVQSINGLSNAVALTQSDAAGSPDFFRLLRDLRRLQVAGFLSVRLQHEAAHVIRHSKSDPGRVYFSFAATRDPSLLPVVNDAKRLLGMPAAATEVEVVYGVSAQPGASSGPYPFHARRFGPTEPSDRCSAGRCRTAFDPSDRG